MRAAPARVNNPQVSKLPPGVELEYHLAGQRIRTDMAHQPADSPASPSAVERGITAGQMRVLTLLMQGKSNKAICRSLGLAEPTVKRHVSAILKALQVSNRTEAALAVSARGWSLPGEAAVPIVKATEPAAPALPDKPSIVVLPFANLSGDPAQDYFADGMVEEITVALGRIPWLFVIASASAFAYRDRTVGVRQIGAELGVRYVLRGSVRKSAEQARIVCELSDAALGRQIWSERFEGELARIFELQDGVAASVSATIAPAVRSREAEHARRKPTSNSSAHDLYLRALPPHRDTLAQNRESLRLLYQAIELDPTFGAAYGLAACCYHMEAVFGWQTPPDGWIDEGARLARLAAEWGDNDPEALWMAGRTLSALTVETDRVLALMNKSLSLNPNSARAWWAAGLTHAHLGHLDAALDSFARSHRLNPRDTSEHAYWNGIALAHLLSGDFVSAKQAIDRALMDWPGSPPSLRAKAAICGLLDRVDEGRACVSRLLALNPATTIATVTALHRFQMQCNPAGYRDFFAGLRRAGLPAGSDDSSSA
jgi:TolB-like protein/DNA-binding CsgD family transcriptional regulator